MKNKTITTVFLFLIVLSPILIQSLWSNEEYRISIKTDTQKKGKVLLLAFDPIRQTKTVVAETSLETGKETQLSFPFKYPDLFRLEVPGKRPFYLVIDKGQNPVKIELIRGKPIKITGSPDSQKLLAYDAFRSESNQRLIRPTYNAMTEAGKRNDQEGEIKAVETYVRHSKLHRKELIDFTEKEIGTSIALYGTSLRWTGDDEVVRLDKLVSAFAKKYPDLPMTKAMKAKVDRFKKVAIGTKAADLMGQTPDGKSITLYNSLGKYTLIDFWGSWCRPCLLQVPDLKKVYTDFHDKGFEIFSYAIDSNKEKWVKKIQDFDMPWKHASDLKGWQSDGGKAYNVTFVPFNLLVNDKGKIVAKNLHHKTLYKKLSQLFNGK